MFKIDILTKKKPLGTYFIFFFIEKIPPTAFLLQKDNFYSLQMIIEYPFSLFFYFHLICPLFYDLSSFPGLKYFWSFNFLGPKAERKGDQRQILVSVVLLLLVVLLFLKKSKRKLKIITYFDQIFLRKRKKFNCQKIDILVNFLEQHVSKIASCFVKGYSVSCSSNISTFFDI